MRPAQAEMPNQPAYPRPPTEIKVKITKRIFHSGKAGEIKCMANVALNTQLHDYVLRGYSYTSLAGVVVELFRSGKVQVDFETYTERLELINLEDCLAAPEAKALLADFMEETEVLLRKHTTVIKAKRMNTISFLCALRIEYGSPFHLLPKKDQ